MILPKLYQCYYNKGDDVHSRLATTVVQPSHQAGYISGLGNVSHIDRATLYNNRASVSDSEANASPPPSRRPTESDIPEESEVE
jgi:hypothetical protein